MGEESIHKHYKILQKKYGLPPFEKVDDAFEIGDIESEQFLLRQVVRKIVDQLEESINHLDAVLQPEAEIGEMRESNAFSEARKKRIYELYKLFRFHYRAAHEALIEGREKECAVFIIAYHGQLPSLRKEMLAVMHDLKEVWHREIEEKNDLAYMG